MRIRRSAFTLMELVVVVAILAALAGLVINKVDWIRRQANMAMGAEASGDVAQNIQTYIASTERLPSGLDSLIASGGTSATLYSGPTAGNGSGGIIGITDGVGNIPSQTQVISVSQGDNRINSLFRLGMLSVNDHDGTSNASDSGTQARVIGSYSPTGKTLNAGSFVFVTPGSAIWNAVYPQSVWGNTYTTSTASMAVNAAGTTVSLICLGIGPNNSMVGNTMVSPPQYPGPDSNIYYYRYIAVFAVYSDGSRAQLKTVVDPYGRTIDSSIQQYSTSGPDNLPPGSRTPE